MTITAWEATTSPDPDDMSDEELVVHFQAGDASAFTVLLERYAGPLYKFLVGQVGKDYADDICQEVFLKVYQKLPCLSEELRCFKAWLYQVASHTAIDHLRHASLISWLSLTGHNEFKDRHGFAASPERRAEEAEFISEVMAHVSPRYRTCVYLDIFESMKQREIATFLKMPERTVRRYISKGKKQLLKEYEHLIIQRKPHLGGE